jgi:hypothetical protein
MLAQFLLAVGEIAHRHDGNNLRCLVSKLQEHGAVFSLRQMPVFPVDSVKALG